MARYQIRTPVEKDMEDVVNEMTEKAWEILKTWNPSDFTRASDVDFYAFCNRVRRFLSGRVKTYKLCGLSNVCLDEVTSTPWAEDEHVLEAEPRDHVYHVVPSRDLDEFLKELALNSLEPVRHLLHGPNSLEEALSTLSIVFRSVLGKYLYYNRICGKTELCIYSSSAPVNAWKAR
jgi:hypothetical protein